MNVQLVFNTRGIYWKTELKTFPQGFYVYNILLDGKSHSTLAAALDYAETMRMKV